MFEVPFKLALERNKFMGYSEGEAYGDQQGSGESESSRAATYPATNFSAAPLMQ